MNVHLNGESIFFVAIVLPYVRLSGLRGKNILRFKSDFSAQIPFINENLFYKYFVHRPFGQATIDLNVKKNWNKIFLAVIEDRGLIFCVKIPVIIEQPPFECFIRKSVLLFFTSPNLREMEQFLLTLCFRREFNFGCFTPSSKWSLNPVSFCY